MSTLGNLAVGVIGDSRQLDRTLDGVIGRVRKFGQDLQQMGTRLVGYGTKMTAAITLPIIGMVTGMAKAAMDFEATEAKYNTVFAGMTGTVDEFIKDFKKLTPATTAEARMFYAGIQDLLVPMGFLREDATELTGELMHVVGALTNFNSATHTTEDVVMAIQSAITGEYQSLKSLGVNIDATTVKEKAMEMGLADASGEISKQAELQALLALIYENSTDALEAYTEANLDTKTKLEIAKKELIDQAKAFGDHLLPLIERGIELFQKLNEWLANLSDRQRESILKWMGLAAAIGPVLIVVGTLMKIIGGIIAVLSVKLIIIGLVIAAIIAFGIWIYKLIKDNEELMAKLTAVWKTIEEAFIEVGQALKETAQVITDRIRDIWEKHGERIMAVLTAIWNQIALTIETVIRIIAGIIKFVLALIRGDWKGAWEALASIGEAIWNFMKGTAQNIFTILKEVLAWIWEAIKSKAIEIWENIKAAVINKAREIYTNARQKLEDLWNYIKGIPAQAYNWGRDILLKLWEGMKSIYNNIKKWFTDNVSALIDTLNPWSKSSPSLIDDIWAGAREIERAYRSIRLPQYNIAAAAGPLAIAGREGQITTNNFDGIFKGAVINVRSEEDIKKIAREIYKMAQSHGRGEGVQL